MATMLFPLAIIAVVLIKLMRRYDVKLFDPHGEGTALRTAVAGKYSQAATVAVLLLLVLIALNPESYLFFLSVDAIGFDLLVALFTLQFRSVIAAGWQYVRRQLLPRIRYCIWMYGVMPRRKLQLATAVAAVSYVGTWVTATMIGK